MCNTPGGFQLSLADLTTVHLTMVTPRAALLLLRFRPEDTVLNECARQASEPSPVLYTVCNSVRGPDYFTTFTTSTTPRAAFLRSKTAFSRSPRALAKRRENDVNPQKPCWSPPQTTLRFLRSETTEEWGCTCVVRRGSPQHTPVRSVVFIFWTVRRSKFF